MATSLQSGALPWDDARLLGSGASCEFVSDAQYGRRDIDLNGQTSGQFNFRFDWSGLSTYPNLTNACDPAQNPVPTASLVESGANLTLGQKSTAGTLTVTFGNDIFTSYYHEIVLTNVNLATREIAGRFKVIAINRANPQDTRVLLINNGFFSGPY